MAREIKFRVWRPETREMDYNFSVRCDLQNALDRKGLYKNWEIMQYTGLKDRNGKEIYEGDIIEIISEENEVMKRMENKAVIEWVNDEVSFVARDMGSGGSWSSILWHRYEVIGNIYEKPNLLN